MKRTMLFSLLAILGLTACGQGPRKSGSAPAAPADDNTLLWRISGNNLSRPSYLFGTMHMICADDIVVSDSLKSAIKRADKVYLEIDMSDMMGMMFTGLTKMSMRGDTTLADLLSAEDYASVKNHFQQMAGGMIPFAMLEKFKPMMIQALLMEQAGGCETPLVMEQLVMQQAGEYDKKIGGLETMEFQLSIFDKIPYKVQAQQLVDIVKKGKNDKSADSTMQVLTQTYRNQQLNKMGELINSDASISPYNDLLLNDRNRDRKSVV